MSRMFRSQNALELQRKLHRECRKNVKSFVGWNFFINFASSKGSKASNCDRPGEYQSGQMGQTVNLLVYTFGGSNPS
ncbi:MAG: hypothetical protein K2I48_07825, partial [Muribaculaceae bacterium]|nr:hypothetical protein [Muribaculaceae bacterium]